MAFGGRIDAGHALTDDFNGPTPTVDILESEPDRTMFVVAYDFFDPNREKRIQYWQTFVITPRSVTVTDELRGNVRAMRVTWPMLLFDGQQRTRLEIAGKTASVELDGRGVRFTIESPADVMGKRSGRVLNHRNGQVQPVIAEFPGRSAIYRIERM